MFRTRMLRGFRLAALAAVVSLALGSMAWAHDDDDYYYRHDEAREHGYQNGYRDGINHGRYDRMQGYRYNYKSDQWEDADGGYQHGMGCVATTRMLIAPDTSTAIGWAMACTASAAAGAAIVTTTTAGMTGTTGANRKQAIQRPVLYARSVAYF